MYLFLLLVVIKCIDAVLFGDNMLAKSSFLVS